MTTNILQIMPAPESLRAVFKGDKENEYGEPVAVLARIEREDFDKITIEAVSMIAGDTGLEIAEDFNNFIRLDWTVKKLWRSKD